MENALRQAIDKNELALNYQPIIDVKSEEIIGAEALLRWVNPDLGSISPVEFIPFAEDTGLILPIGEWISYTACKTADSWQDKAAKPLKVAVNLSSRQFQQADVPFLIQYSLEKSGLAPEQLTLEITESLLLNDDDKALNTLKTLRNMGMQIAIDDFGTGYSSLSYLKRFPVTILKIGRSFVSGLSKDSEDLALIQAILSMAKSLNLKVVAEGVETSEQYQILKDNGCDFVQGYLFSKPPPADNKFKELLGGKLLPS